MSSNGTTTSPAYDLVGAIMSYEQGTMSYEDALVFFQHLVDTGDAWTLQGRYGRTAQALLDAGKIHPATNSL